MDFVYVYRERPANADELRWSMRSIHENYQGNANVIVAGDRPPWFGGTCLNVPYRGPGFVDVANQTVQAALSPSVGQEFTWMMDDIIFCRMFNDAWLRIPRASGDVKTDPKDFAPKGWKRAVHRTAHEAAKKGYKPKFYATHLPHVMQSENVLKLTKEFDLYAKPPLLIDQLYGSVFYQNPHSSYKVLCFLREKQNYTLEKIEAYRRAKPMLCYPNEAWGEGLLDWLRWRFPNPAPWEIEKATPIPTPRQQMVSKMMRREDLFTPATTNWLDCEYRSPEPVDHLVGRRCPRKPQPVYDCSKYDTKTALADIWLPDIRACNSCPVVLDKIGAY